MTSLFPASWLGWLSSRKAEAKARLRSKRDGLLGAAHRTSARPGGTGPCRSDRIIKPLCRKRPATVGIACRRCAGSRCIHTAVSMMRSNSALARNEAGEIGQAVVQPFDLTRGMQVLRLHAQLRHRLGRDHLISHRRELRGVAPGPCADIEHGAGRGRHQMQHLGVQFREADALHAVASRWAPCGIAFRAAHARQGDSSFPQCPSGPNRLGIGRIALFCRTPFPGWELRGIGLG